MTWRSPRHPAASDAPTPPTSRTLFVMPAKIESWLPGAGESAVVRAGRRCSTWTRRSNRRVVAADHVVGGSMATLTLKGSSYVGKGSAHYDHAGNAEGDDALAARRCAMLRDSSGAEKRSHLTTGSGTTAGQPSPSSRGVGARRYTYCRLPVAVMDAIGAAGSTWSINVILLKASEWRIPSGPMNATASPRMPKLSRQLRVQRPTRADLLPQRHYSYAASVPITRSGCTRLSSRTRRR